MKLTMKATAGGRMTGQDCGMITLRQRLPAAEIHGGRGLDLLARHRFEAAADDLGGIGRRIDADGDDGDGEQRGVLDEGLR